MLYLIPTPIGNLEDITLRALRLLKEVDVIFAEDTRQAKKLLNHFEISTPILSHHAFNEHATTDTIIKRLQTGETIALVSDAGTPAISDPGFFLVRACKKEGLEVQCLPGPTALIPALVNSGIPCDKFYFEGFLPHKKGKKTRVEYLANKEETFILYESPYRLIKTLHLLAEHCGKERSASVSRELSKLHEENKSGSLEELISHFEEKPKIKGEIVIVVSGR